MNRLVNGLLLHSVVLCLCAGSCSLAQARELVPLHIGFGRTSSMDIRWADAKAAFKVFAESLGRKRGYDLDVTIHSFESDEQFLEAVSNNTLNLVIMVPWYYFGDGLEAYLEPCFVPVDSGKGAREYVLLVNTDSSIRKLLDLKGKRVALLENTRSEMSGHWLQTMLLEEGLGCPESFFASSVVKVRPTQVILPVFFGQIDGCVVSRPVFEMMSQLNPQVGQRLRVIAFSDPLVNTIEYVARNGPQWDSVAHRADLIEALETIDQDPMGMQILTLFKTDRLAPYDESCMTATRALKKKYDLLVGELPVLQDESKEIR